MRIFISWSKAKSKDFAIKTKNLIETLNPHIKAFVSETDIEGGEDVQDKIIEQIVQCDKLILCFTKENKLSPWLLFEAGYARGLHKTVIPILFDDDPNWHSWIDNPMNIARELRINNNDFSASFHRSLEILHTTESEALFAKYRKEVETIRKRFLPVSVQCEDFVESLLNHSAFKLENPYFRDKKAFFLSGFESFDLLKVLTDSFLYSGKHLWVYGRKNMKLFGGSFNSFFDYLHQKSLENTKMAGIDFRCLFLNPDSIEVESAHMHQEVFRPELEATIKRAKIVIGNNVRLNDCFRLYSNRRDEIIIRLDNSIIYSKPIFDANGHPHLLTNSAFEVFGVGSTKGKRCAAKFESVWENAIPM